MIPKGNNNKNPSIALRAGKLVYLLLFWLENEVERKRSCI